MDSKIRVGWLVIAAAFAMIALVGIRKFTRPVVMPPDSSTRQRVDYQDHTHEPTILQADSSHGEMEMPPGLPRVIGTFQSHEPTSVMVEPFEHRSTASHQPGHALLPLPFALERNHGFKPNPKSASDLHGPAADEIITPTTREDREALPITDDVHDVDLPVRLPETEGPLKKASYDASFEYGQSDRPSQSPNPPHESQFTETQFEDNLSNQQIVQKNDSFWWISQRAYGRGDFYKALFMHNRDKFPFPDRLPERALVETPSIEELYRSYPQFCPPRKG